MLITAPMILLALMIISAVSDYGEACDIEDKCVQITDDIDPSKELSNIAKFRFDKLQINP